MVNNITKMSMKMISNKILKIQAKKIKIRN